MTIIIILRITILIIMMIILTIIMIMIIMTIQPFDYGQFSTYHVCFCGLDSGNSKFETVRTNKQHICF